MGRKMLWTETNCLIVEKLFSNGIPTIDLIIKAVNKIDHRQISNAFLKLRNGKSGNCALASPRGVIYRAHELKCISKDERDMLLRDYKRWLYKKRKVSRTTRDEIIARDGGCLICRSRNNLQIDHIVPIRYGGTSDIENLQTLCKKCNKDKGTMIGDFRVGKMFQTISPETGQRIPVTVPGWTLIFQKWELDKMQEIVNYLLQLPEA